METADFYQVKSSKIIILIDRDDGKKKQIMATPSSMAFI